ncbi:MAG: GTP cyclohydrolase I FolE [Burkholderiaceae bacterium]|nr:GTP cyclohydrolase I FolE [Microbacteriaceae bacterium]
MAGIDTDRIAAAVAEILSAIGEDPARPGLDGTPQRVADAHLGYYSGVGVDPLGHLADPVPVDDATGDLVLVRDIEFVSTCEHHLLPFLGVAHVAYAPRQSIVGLGKLASVVDTLASRPQLQERLTEEIADALETGLDPRGVFVMIDAMQLCVSARGSRQRRSTTVTMAARGSFATPAGRAEIVALIGAPNG